MRELLIDDLTDDELEALEDGPFIAGKTMVCAATSALIKKGQTAYLWNTWVLYSQREVDKFKMALAAGRV